MGAAADILLILLVCGIIASAVVVLNAQKQMQTSTANSYSGVQLIGPTNIAVALPSIVSIDPTAVYTQVTIAAGLQIALTGPNITVNKIGPAAVTLPVNMGYTQLSVTAAPGY